MSDITRLAIVNRGAAAMRLINAAREYAAERRRDLRVIALLSESDREALFVREADEAFIVEGPSLHADLGALEQALVRAQVDAAWVGWGALAQDPAFAELCDRLGIIDIGLDAATLRSIADRDLLAVVAHDAGVPLSSLDIVERGYARHLDVLVAGDQGRSVWVLGAHDGTIQRRTEKVIVETASTVITGIDDAALRAVAARVTTRAGIIGAATLAFVREEPDSPLSLVRISGGLPLGHGVTEITSGIDLAKIQLHLAEGGRLEGAAPRSDGHAIAVRLNAEDTELGFAPAPGRVALFSVPTGPGLRIDPAVTEGEAISPGTDPMLAEIVAWGRDRSEARVRLRRALTQLPVVLDGGTTNKGFLLSLLDRVEVLTGQYDTGWLDRLAAAGGGTAGDDHGDLAVLMAAIDGYDDAQRHNREHLFATARRGRPELSTEVGRRFELCLRGNEYAVIVRRTGRRRYRARVDGHEMALVVTRLDAYQSRVEIGGRSVRVVSAVQGGDHLVEIDGVPHRLTRADGGIVRALSPGVVVSVHVRPGDLVRQDDQLVTVESMKMETPVGAPFAGRVRQVLIGTNVHVDAGTPLVQLEPAGRLGGTASAPRVTFDATAMPSNADAAPEERVASTLDALIRLVMGFDVDLTAANRLATEQAAAVHDLPADSPDLLAGEIHLLSVFTDLRALFRSQRDGEEGEVQLRSSQEHLAAFLRAPGRDARNVPPRFLASLRRALARYGVRDLDHTEPLEEALYWIMQSGERVRLQLPAVIGILERWLAHPEIAIDGSTRSVLDRLVAVTQRDLPLIADLAREVRYRTVDRPVVEAARRGVVEQALAAFDDLRAGGEQAPLVRTLVECPEPLESVLIAGAHDAEAAPVAVELLTRRHHRWGTFGEFETMSAEGSVYVLRVGHQPDDDDPVVIVAGCAPWSELPSAVASALRAAHENDGVAVQIELYTWPDSWPDGTAPLAGVALDGQAFADHVASLLEGSDLDGIEYLVVGLTDQPEGAADPEERVAHVTFRPVEGHAVEDRFLRGLHPMIAERLRLWRLSGFRLEWLPSAPGVHVFRGIARENESDERLFAVAEVRDLTPVRDSDGRLVALPDFERTLLEAFDGLRRFQAPRAPGQRLWWNRVLLRVWPPVELTEGEIESAAFRLLPAAVGLGLEEVHVMCRRPDPQTGVLRERALRFTATTADEFRFSETALPSEPLATLDEYSRKVVQSRRRGTIYPYELLRGLVAPQVGARSGVDGGWFAEHDLDGDGRLVPVDRLPGRNTASIVTGLVANFSPRHPEGMVRVVLLGDPTHALGALAEPECRRIMAAIDLAEEMQVPVEWFALSAGAKIAMDSGTENMDWIAAVLRRIIEFTQAGSEINVVVTGINVGAQPYWNAEATMLMHTKGILVMSPDSAMVLTGKQALDFSGGISAPDNFGIGGYERVMGPNGQAQYWAPDLAAACAVLLAHYAHTYVVPGERFPRTAPTTDPRDRDIRSYPHQLAGSDLQTVGEIFDPHRNPDRKKPFDMRTVMRAVVDADHATLERWRDLGDAETAVVWDAHLGGIPVCMLGIEAHALPRRGAVPADGPDQWTSGTLFPQSSKKIARAINATTGVRPLVVLANLSGFDGSPESMRRIQLEYGAEIGRAVVNFRGPIVFCVVSRFHGGAFVVFSRLLNTQLVTLAVEGSHASVIGGAPAAAVVFAGEVERRTRSDSRLTELESRIAAAGPDDRARLRRELGTLRPEIRSEHLGAVATEFDAIHSVERAQQVGSVDSIIPAARLRPLLIEAVERGMAAELERLVVP